jgi:hypothetical protein
MLHVLVGSAEDERDYPLPLRPHEILPWRVPKKAKPGDRVLMYLPSTGFTALGLVDSQPEKEGGYYNANLTGIVRLAKPVPFAFVLQNHPDWRWLKKPMTYTTIDGAIEKRLDALLDDYQRRSAASEKGYTHT